MCKVRRSGYIESQCTRCINLRLSVRGSGPYDKVIQTTPRILRRRDVCGVHWCVGYQTLYDDTSLRSVRCADSRLDK